MVKFSYDDFSAWNRIPGSNCDGTAFQSPIDFGATALIKYPSSLRFSIYDLDVEVDSQIHVLPSNHNAAEIRVLDTVINRIEHEYVTYENIGIEMHFPSEHTFITGEHTDAEVQFIHLSKWGSYSIVSFLVNFGNPGVETEFFNNATFPETCSDGRAFDQIKNDNFDICASASTAEGGKSIVEVRGVYDILGLKLSDLEDSQFRYYEGSRTTPGCASVVNWFVYDHVVTVNADLNYPPYKRAFIRSDEQTGNNRDIQPGTHYSLAVVSDVCCRGCSCATK